MSVSDYVLMYTTGEGTSVEDVEEPIVVLSRVLYSQGTSSFSCFLHFS